MTRFRTYDSDQRGYTLIEVMVVLGLATILFTLGAMAVRHFWMVQSLHASADAAVTQLRRQQARVVSETHPWVYGARFRVGSSSWGLVRYNMDTGVCSEVEQRTFEGTSVTSASFSVVSGLTTQCRSSITGASTDQFAFFFARGTATEGSITLTQSSLGRSRTVTVKPITGRVESL